MPRASMAASARWNAASCARAYVLSRSSAVAKWENTPSSTSPGSPATYAASSAASSGRTPMRPMPVSTLRCTLAVFPCATAAAESAAASSRVQTVCVMS